MQMPGIKAGIIGGAGYTGGELIRILINHPGVTITFAHSRSNAGKPVYSVHQDLLGETELVFTDQLNDKIDVLFLCLGHGESKKFLTENTIPPNTRVIDLANDFRLTSNQQLATRNFVYGLPKILPTPVVLLLRFNWGFYPLQKKVY
jgi:N-acetyl-gamma-glutamyl-phosphate reductase